MKIADIDKLAGESGLTILSGFHPDAAEPGLRGTGTVLLLGPSGPDFWPIFSGAPEYADGEPDPLNRWSERVIGALAGDLGGTALFPFGGPPYQPFLSWAKRGGQAWDSPVGMLVHARMGLLVSYRGAIALPERLPLPEPSIRPCETCAAPCLTACPAGALTGVGYDVPACHDYLSTPAGSACLDRGCAVRRACPVGWSLRPEAQSAFHMAAFHGNQS